MTTPSMSRNPLRDYPPESAVATETMPPTTTETPEGEALIVDEMVTSYEISVRRVATIIAASLIAAAIVTGATVALTRRIAARRAQTTP